MKGRTAAVAAMVIVGCGVPEASDEPHTAREPVEETSSDGEVVPDIPAVKPGLMEVNPNPAEPGDVVQLRFPEETLRGVAFSMYASDGDRWQLTYHLLSDGGREANDEPQWYDADDPPGHDDVGVGGPGPDQVRVPHLATPGEYLICTANSASDFCAPLTVERTGRTR